MKSRYALLALTLISIGTSAHADVSAELDKAIDNMFNKMLECHEQEPSSEKYAPIMKEAMNQARISMKADMSKFTKAQADAALACLKSMEGKSCSALDKSDTPECKRADDIIR